MRVWPRGKALASQANIHGFESRHPLSILKNLSIRGRFFFDQISEI